MKRNRKRVVCLGLTAALIFGTMGTGIESQAAPKTKKIIMNKKKVTLKAGKTFKLKVKKVKPAKASKKVTYKSSNKKIASVSKKGVIKAKKAGRAKITVTSKKNKKAKAKVTVIVTGANSGSQSNNGSAGANGSGSTATPTPTNRSTIAPTENPTGTPKESPTGTPTDPSTGTPKESPTGTPTDPSTGTPEETPTATPTGTPATAEEAELDLSKPDSYIIDGDGVEATYIEEEKCLEAKMPFATGITFMAPQGDYKYAVITYETDFAFDVYGFDADVVDGKGQEAQGQHELGKLTVPAEGTGTAEFKAGSDYAGGKLTAVKLVSLDWDNYGTKTIKVKSVKFIGEKPEDLSVPDGFRARVSANEGKVEDITYGSTVIVEGETVQRKAKVVLPKGYTPEKKYPVVYMQHGIFGDETSLYGDGTQYVIWNAIANGDAEDMIVVFPNACANKEGKGDGFSLEHYAAYDNFINDLTECLMPYINEHYSTLTGRENTAICGFSMGGRVSLQIGFMRQEDFGYIGGFCPAFGIFEYENYGVHENGFFTEDTFTLKQEFMDNTLVLIAAGPKDTIVRTEPKRYADALEKNGVPHIYYETQGGDSKNPGSGGHDSTVYQHGLYNFLKRIFKQESSDTPEQPTATATPEPTGTPAVNPPETPTEAELDLSKPDSYIIDGDGVEAKYIEEEKCLEAKMPFATGITFMAPQGDYKYAVITYETDFAFDTYGFDADVVDGKGQEAQGQHAIGKLTVPVEGTGTAEFKAGSDYAGGKLTAVKLVSLDWDNYGTKTIKVKSVKFSNEPA